MPTTKLTRFDIALNIDDTSSLGERLAALHDVIGQCRNDDAPLADDPAVRLLAARVGEFARLGDTPRSQLVHTCAAEAKAAQSLPEIVQIMSQPVGYDAARKEAFRRVAMQLLRRLSKAMSLSPGTFDLRFNKGGIAVSGEATLHTETFYVQVSQSSMRNAEVLYRRCRGREDYCGERNHFASVAALSDPQSLARRIHGDLRLDGLIPEPSMTDLFRDDPR